MWFLEGCSSPDVSSKPSALNMPTAEKLARADLEHACPLDRYSIEKLAPKLEAFMPHTKVSTIAELLRTQVNLTIDKVPRSLKDRFTPEDSISAFEAFAYSQKIITEGAFGDGSISSQLAHGLITFYFGFGDPLRSIPPAHKIAIKHCHDGDTCTIVETQDLSCQISEVETSVRISGIDAPELGVYYGPWTNQKLMDNVDKLRAEWLGDTTLPKSVVEAANKLIALRINYTGQLASLLRNELHTWNETSEFQRLLEESQIKWMWDGSGDKTPAALCGMWQPYDRYGRRLGSFYQAFSTFLSMYLQTRLSQLMATEGVKKYEEYKKKAEPLLYKLKKMGNSKVRSLVGKLENTAPDPRVIFSPVECDYIEKEYRKFIKDHGDHYEIDDQIMQIITGTVYAYEKYRNQDGDVYQMANDIARLKGFGLWTEPTFATLYIINERDVRYHPPQCQ